MPPLNSSSTADFRLPLTAAPQRYSIHLRPDFDAGTFRGDEQVELDIVEEIEEIVCNAADLEISVARIRPLSLSGEEVVELPVKFDPKRERVHFLLPRALPPGQYDLHLEFAGTFNDKLRGFYINTFTDSDGREQTMATTQFQSTDARRAFPCWDEPDHKATFAVVLDVPPQMMAISNGPELSAIELSDGWSRVSFGETPVMSTYIVAFVIGPLEVTGPVEADGIPIRVVHIPGKSKLARHALEVAAHALSFYREWFNLPYPASKLDLVAVPNRGGAMENLGAAIFIESALLVDPEDASGSEIESVTEVIAHEIAHMWFGDLVTMRWWNGLWLNEAFATFISLKCLDSFRPEWECWTTFGMDRETAMQVDALASTRPIEFTVQEPDEAEAMYDSLTYLKGATVLRMIEQYLGEDAFQEGVRRYLAAHQFANTETSDLWEAIESAVEDEPVHDMMRSFIFQGGYPLVTASEAPGGMQLSQEQFGLASASTWIVPCLVRDLTESSNDLLTRSKVLLDSSVTDLRFGDSSEGMVVNAGASGFFRTRYTPVLRSALLSRFSSLLPLEQFGFVSDAWALSLFGVTPLSEFIEVVSALSGDVDPGVFAVIEESIRTFDHSVAPSDRMTLQAWTRSLLEPVIERMGWDPLENEGARSTSLRSIAIRQLGDVGEEQSVIDRSRDLFERECHEGVPVPASTAAAVFSVVAAHGAVEDLVQLKRRFLHARDPQDEQRLLEALSFARDRTFTAELCASGFAEMKTPHVAVLMRQLMTNRHAAPVVWQFLKSNWHEMLDLHAGKAFWRLLSGVSWLVAPEPGESALVEDVRAFLGSQELDGMQRPLDQALEMLGLRSAFVTREGKALGRLLRDGRLLRAELRRDSAPPL